MAGTWAQSPAPPTAPEHPSAVAVGAIAAWCALAPAAARAVALPSDALPQVATLVAIALAVVLVLPRRWWWARLAAIALAGLAMQAAQGTVISGLAMAGLVLASWVGQGVPPVPGLPRPHRGAIPPVVVLVGVSAWQATKLDATWQPFVPLVLALAMPVLTRLGGGTLDRFADRLGVVVGHGVGAVVFTALWLPTVLVPWAFQRATRLDPLEPVPGWRGRDRRPIRTAQPWTTDPCLRSRPRAARVRYAALGPALAVVAVGGVVAWRANQPGPDYVRSAGETTAALTGGRLEGPVPVAHRGDVWYEDYRDDAAWIFDERAALRPFDVYRIQDATTRTISMRNWERQTWGLDGDDAAVRIWWYGGGGAFGLDQRDDHTIPSELARLAAADGIDLDVHNRAMPGQLHWRAATRFGWEIASEPAPDLAVFYVGAEEVATGRVLVEGGHGDVLTPYEPFIEDLYDRIQEGQPEPPTPPESAELIGLANGGDPGPSNPGELAVERFERSLAMTADTSQVSGVEVRTFWQPTRHERPGLEQDAIADAEAEAEWGDHHAAARAALPDQVVDLGDALDGLDAPVFVDETNVNEAGAAAIAEAIYAELRPLLLELRGDES